MCVGERSGLNPEPGDTKRALPTELVARCISINIPIRVETPRQLDKKWGSLDRPVGKKEGQSGEKENFMAKTRGSLEKKRHVWRKVLFLWRKLKNSWQGLTGKWILEWLRGFYQAPSLAVGWVELAVGPL